MLGNKLSLYYLEVGNEFQQILELGPQLLLPLSSFGAAVRQKKKKMKMSVIIKIRSSASEETDFFWNRPRKEVGRVVWRGVLGIAVCCKMISYPIAGFYADTR